jgi:hypothetical protein
LGNLNKALANYKLAVANGNRSVQSDVTRVTNLLKKNTKQTSQKIAFNDGAARIKKKATQKTTMANVKNGASRA